MSEPTITTYSRDSMLLALQRNLRGERGHYGQVDDWLRQAFEKYPLLGQDVLIYGSCEQGFGPWYEMMCLSHGAGVSVTDYNEITYDTSRIAFIRPSDVTNCYWVSIALAISSFEHSGLGRYGDPVDPNGDLKAMESVGELLGFGDLLFLAVPLGLDKTVGNSLRIYGRQRLPLLLKGWRLVDSFGFEDYLLDRDTVDGWCPRHPDGSLLHPEYPEYSPILVLQKGGD